MSARLKVLLLLLAVALSLRAQSWDGLRGLQPGDRIRVQESGGTEHTGSFASVAADTLTLRTAKGEVLLERVRIRHVQVRSGARRARNGLIGAGIGVAIGITIDQTLGVRLRNEGNDSGRALMYAAPIGLLGGLGAAFPAYRTAYRAR